MTYCWDLCFCSLLSIIVQIMRKWPGNYIPVSSAAVRYLNNSELSLVDPNETLFESM